MEKFNYGDCFKIMNGLRQISQDPSCPPKFRYMVKRNSDILRAIVLSDEGLSETIKELKTLEREYSSKLEAFLKQEDAESKKEEFELSNKSLKDLISVKTNQIVSLQEREVKPSPVLYTVKTENCPVIPDQALFEYLVTQKVIVD